MRLYVPLYECICLRPHEPAAVNDITPYNGTTLEMGRHRFTIWRCRWNFKQRLGRFHWSWGCDCLITWFCYQLITIQVNKTAAPPLPDPLTTSKRKKRKTMCIFCGVYIYIPQNMHTFVGLFRFLWLYHQLFTVGVTNFPTFFKVCPLMPV